MNLKIERSGRALEMPLNAGSRALLLVAIVLVLTSYAIPLWNLSSRGPDGEGSRVSVYSYSLGIPSHDGGTNSSHAAAAVPSAAWVGAEPSGWIAIGLAAMALLFLRAVLLGTTRTLIDAFVLYVFLTAASLWSFSLQFFRFARHLAPAGPGAESFWGILFGGSRFGAREFAASPAAGAWTLAVVGFVLGAALVVAWKNAREELSADCLVAG